MPFKERVRQEREHEILDAARDVFARDGYERASIDSIAERVGIAKGTVYLHFSSKEEILRALLRQIASGLAKECQQRLAGQPTAVAKLQAVIGLLVDRRFSHGPLVRVLAAEVPHFVGTWRQEGAGDSLRQLVAELIRQGQREGDLHPEVDPDIASKGLLLLIYMTDGIGPRQPTKQEVLRQVNRLFFHGISTEVQR